MLERVRMGGAVVLLGWAAAAGAEDWTVAAEAGISPERDADLWRVSVGASLPADWIPVRRPLDLRWELSAGRLAAQDRDEAPNEDVTTATARLLLRYRPAGLGPVFLEMGSGPAWHTELWIGNTNLGNKLQFRSHAGVGVRLGRGWRLRYRYAHTSNAHLGNPNPGLNSHEIGVARRL